MCGDTPRPIRAVRPLHEEDWESRLRPKPTAAAVLATLASGGVDAVLERWGGRHPAKLIASAEKLKAGHPAPKRPTSRAEAQAQARS